MTSTMQLICDDLGAEKDAVVAMVADLDADAWDTATPAEPWSIRDQISHLAYFDEKAVLAHEDPGAFLAEIEDGRALQAIRQHLDLGRTMAGAELLAWWDEANSALRDLYGSIDPKQRVVWYGPPMAARSKVTARIMETWAHGQDIADALGVVRAPSARLRHVCHIGVRARAFAFLANGLVPPQTDIHVVLTAPGGEVWEWGGADAAEVVSGSALGFALLVTQRRHRDDVDVEATGDVARQWLGIAQAFAGPPGEGRRPGQFAHLER